MKTVGVGMCFVAVCSWGVSQSKAAAPQTLSGCVARIPNVADKYVIAVDNRCMLLTGQFDAVRVADHQITVAGVVTESTGMQPLMLTVRSVKNVQAACSKTCTLEPPGTRGVHGKERPGTEGGTPGLHDPAEHPPQ